MKKSITKHFIFLFTLIFASCSNLFTSQDSLPSNTKIHFTGTLCITGALPESLNQVQGDSHAELDSASQSSSSRSALPSITPGLDYYYYVTATQTDGSGTFNINSINDSGSFDTSNDVTFALELTTGKWDIECGIKKAASSGVVSGNDVTVMSDTYPAPLTSANPVLNHTFYPKPSQSGEGKVELKISVDTEILDFGQVTASCSKSVWAEKVSGPSYDTEEEQWIIQTSNTLPSGTYEVAFNFYNTNDILLYSTVQTINVFDNMLTNTWVSDGSGAINDSGEFNLTANLISQFARTTFYVGDTGVGKEPSDTEGTGSPYTPLKTISKAVQIIQSINDGSSFYRLYICEDQDLSDLTGTLSLVPADKAIKLLIQGYDAEDSGKKIILSGYDENSEKSQFNGSFITIAGKSNTETIVTLRNLSIYGHTNTTSASNGGGLLCISAKVSLENVDIRDNECDKNGGGIFATSSSIVTIKDSYIQGNKATNASEALGGGIALKGGTTVYIEGNTHILENESAKNGGGIGVSATGSNKLYINDGHIYANTAVNGGGVYNGGELYFSAGGISQNTATTAGGGVYSTGSLFMYGSAVIGDSSKTTAATDLVHSNKAGVNGGGICSTGKLYLGYSSWTSENDNTPQELTGGVFYNFSPDVGGIYQYADNTSYLFKMKFGSVSYNAGRGIYVGKCTFTMTGGTVKGNTAIKGSDLNTSYQLNGAGLYAGDGATVIISDGTITENHAEGNGGGLYGALGSSVIILEGGTISGNTADGNGNGIAIANGSLKMKENASVDSNNDVYLASGKYITVTGALTGTSPVATVTLDDFSRGKTVVQADGTNVTDLTQYKNYFTLTDQNWKCKVSSDKQYLVLDAPIYVAGQTNHPYCGVAGNDTNGDGTKAKPFATIAKAIELLTDKDTDYTIYIDGEVTGSQTIPDTLKKDETGTYKAQSLTIEGVNGINSNHEPIATLDGGFSSINTGRVLTIETDVPVKIKTLTIKNGYLNEESDDRDGGGIYISSSSTVTLGDEGSVNGDYTNTVLLTNNYGVSGNAIYSEGVLTLCNCTFKNNQSSSSTPGDNSPAIEFNKNDLILAGGNIHFSSNTPGDIYIGAKTSNGSTGSSTPCKIQINVALPDDFSASLCAFRNAWAYDRLRSKQILDGLSSEYSKFSLYGITDTANTYAINSSGEITQTAN